MLRIFSALRPLARALSRSRSDASQFSRASSAASSISSRASSLSSLDCPDTLRSHLDWHGQSVGQKALATAQQAGLRRPRAAARKAAKLAIARETARVQGLFVDRAKAEKTLIRARGAQTLATLALHQAERDHGPFSLVAHEARKALRQATRAAGAASADLYLISTSL